MTPPTTSSQDNTSLASVFERIYRDKVWGEGSGPGSDPVQAKPYLDYLLNLIADKEINQVLDVGCGDQRIYRGELAVRKNAWWWCIDVAPNLCGDYDCIEIHDCDMERVDLVIIKDVLQHLPHAENLRILRKAMEAKWVLVTNDWITTGNKRDIEAGDYRPVDVLLPPYGYAAQDSFGWGSIPFSKLAVLLKGGQQLPDQPPTVSS